MLNNGMRDQRRLVKLLEDRIDAASQRYLADAILVVRGYRTGTGWESRWRARVDGVPSEWVETHARVDCLLVDGINRVADQLDGP